MVENIATLFSAANLAFSKKANEYEVSEVKGLLGTEPDLKGLVKEANKIKLRFVRDTKDSIGTGASCMIQKAYSSSPKFPGPTVPLAIKRMNWKTIDDTEPEVMYELLDREVNALRSLCYGENSHPGFTKFYGSFYNEEADEHWLAFEFCSGGDLQFVKDLPINFDCLASIAAGTLEGLQVLHEKGFIHADIKPDNLLLAPPGIIKICDFGLTACVEGVEEPELHALGTPRYMSPEHMKMNLALDEQVVNLNGCHYDNKTDIWALGVVLLEMLLGTTPLYQLRTISSTLFNVYVQGMAKDLPRNKGSGLKQLLILRQSARTWLSRSNIDANDDIELLMNRFPGLFCQEQKVRDMLEKPRLAKNVVDTSSTVPSYNIQDHYRLNLCLDFIAHCLICNYEKRPSAEMLKTHQFVKSASNEYTSLVPKIEELQKDYKNYRTRKRIWKKYALKHTVKPLNELIVNRLKSDKLSIQKLN